MKFKIVSRGFITKKILLFIFLSLVLFVCVFLEDKGKGNVFTKIAMGAVVICFVTPHLRRPKIVGEIVFNDNHLSIIERGKEKIIQFTDINYIEIDYHNYYNETTLNSGKIIFENGAANTILINTKNERIKSNFFSQNGEEDNMIRNYLSVLEENAISYKINIEKKIFKYDASQEG